MGTLINVMILVAGVLVCLIGAGDDNPFLAFAGLLMAWAGMLALGGVIEGGDGL